MEFVIKDEHLIDGVLPEGFRWPDGVTEVLVELSSAIKSLTSIPASVRKLKLVDCIQMLELLVQVTGLVKSSGLMKQGRNYLKLLRVARLFLSHMILKSCLIALLVKVYLHEA